jgi:acetyl-CoA carboxylase carboxyl transferase subunit beta
VLTHRLVERWDADVLGDDPLCFPGYRAKLDAAHGEAVRTGRTEHYALIEGRFDVLGGSMGAAVGERVVRAFDRATELRLPVVAVTRSGGARMQEGMVSLIQMARTTDAVRRHAEAGLLYVAVHASPTTGGVFASFGSLADLRAAEAGAVLGFAGPRVVEDTLGAPLPTGSHTAESAYRHGLVDAVLPEALLAGWLEGALGLRAWPPARRTLPAPEPVASAGAWGEVLRARAVGRPTGWDWAARICSSWTDLHGTDPVVRAGLATVGGRRVVVIAFDRYAGDGRPRPAGFRLAQRAVTLADRLGLPVLSLVDTPGADPSAESEAAGIAGEIARTFAAFAALRSPSVAVCVGEGGSGGALAVAATDVLLIQEHAVFSVIAPEGAASIIERDPDRAPELAERLALTAGDLLALGIVDGIVEEGDDQQFAEAVHAALDRAQVGDRNRRFDAATARWLRRAAPPAG